MNELNLRAVRELLPFKELFATSNDYMREASFLPHIEISLNTPVRTGGRAASAIQSQIALLPFEGSV